MKDCMAASTSMQTNRWAYAVKCFVGRRVQRHANSFRGKSCCTREIFPRSV